MDAGDLAGDHRQENAPFDYAAFTLARTASDHLPLLAVVAVPVRPDAARLPSHSSAPGRA